MPGPRRVRRVAGAGGWALPPGTPLLRKQAPPVAPPLPHVVQHLPPAEALSPAERAAIAAWWAAQHEAKCAAAPAGWVFPPETFDIAVAPGVNVQTAIDRCPPGGTVLLLPGTHEGPLVLRADQEVHVFGRGKATLRTSAEHVIVSASEKATLDGLVVRTGAHSFGSGHFGILVTSGKLRVQACDVSSQSRAGICAKGPSADPFVVCCHLHHGARAGIKFAAGSQGIAKGCTCVCPPWE